MAIQSYAESMPELAKWEKDVANYGKKLDAIANQAYDKAEQVFKHVKLRQVRTPIARKKIEEKIKAWRVIANEIVELQQEMLVAISARYNAKMVPLAKKIMKLDKKAIPLRKDISRIHMLIMDDEMDMSTISGNLAKIFIGVDHNYGRGLANLKW